jgi:16S rRNA (adenine1518-N6/adenine1519-N6)-dimethyltransferase
MEQDLTDIKNLKEFLLQNSMRPLKKWGQNFLIDKNILEKIIHAGNLSKKDIVVEVGPGFGALTVALAKKVKKVIAIEKDPKIIPLLEEITKSCGNVKIINEDILSSQIQKELSGNFFTKIFHSSFLNKEKKYKVIANVPYYITSPIIRKFLEEEVKPSLLVLTIQKEVAERIVSKPPNMNLLAVSVQFFATPEIISHISPCSFYPSPSVTSSILRITPHSKNNYDKDFQKIFFFLLRAGFSHPRKQLIKNFNMLDKVTLKTIQLEKDFLIKKIEETNIDLQRRAETLNIEEWIQITKTIIKPN